MKDPYCYAPEPGEDGAGTVKLADDYGVHHVFTPDQAREFAHATLAAADYADAIAQRRS